MPQKGEKNLGVFNYICFSFCSLNTIGQNKVLCPMVMLGLLSPQIVISFNLQNMGFLVKFSDIFFNI